MKNTIIITLFLLVNCLVYSQACNEVPKSIINGTNGFSVEGKVSQDDLGYAAKSAGDINHDGIPDIMIGAPGVDFGGLTDVGEIYIIFGKAGLSIATFDVTTLDGTNGFVIRGVLANEKLGEMISTAGDFNNDGTDDIIIGYNDATTKGKATVFYGKNAGFSALYNRTDFNSTNSVTFTVDLFGVSSSTPLRDVSYAGDVNKDGIADVIFNMYGNDKANYFVVFGKAGILDLNVSALNGTNGFYLLGFSQSFSGQSSIGRNAGDVNNDGIDDLILGFPSYDETGSNAEGRVVVYYGRTTFSGSITLDAMTATDGFIVTSTGKYAYTGTSIASAGDFNKDGIDDVIIGAPGKIVNSLNSVGEAYIVFGRNTPFPATFSTASLTASTGVVFQGKLGYEEFGTTVNGLKDINKDGIEDVVITSRNGGLAKTGAAYVVFGTTTSTGLISPNMILGSIGYQVFNDGSSSSNYFFGNDAGGIGDFNNDGTNDFIIGSIRKASYYYKNGNAYIFYGEKFDRADVTPPVISCPTGQELYANATLPNYVSFLPTVSDNCTDNMDLVFTQTPPQGTLFTADTDVTITVTDKANNTSSCSFLVKLRTTSAQIDCKTFSFPVKDLNGSNGFTVYGEKTTRELGSSVNTAGDINGDGIADFIVGAPGNYAPWYGKFENEYRIIKGAAYLIYGTASGFPPNIDLGLLDGTRGFAIRNDNPSSNFPVTGYDVGSAGDINGDGIGDFMISDPYRHSSYGSEVGHTYIVFGKTTGFPAEFNLSTLNGTNGFTLIGVSNYGDVGISVDTIGDINGDGIQDIAAITGGSGGDNGKCFVVYGSHSAFPAVLLTNQINGTNGFVIEGDATVGAIGSAVSGLGDINGDGISDFALGSYYSTTNARKFVVYGRSSNFPSNLNVSALNGANGFVLENTATPLNTSMGISKTGDINGDGYNDVAVAKDYVLFGGPSIPAIMDLKNLDGTNGFKLTNGSSGSAFGPAGDFNDDGIDDYVFQNSNNFYVLFGKSTWTPTVKVSSLTPKDGLMIITLSASKYSVNYAGDVNKDGISDLIIGNGFDSYGSNMKVNNPSGFAFVVYGKKITDTEKPVITGCPANKVLNVGDLIPNYKTNITVTDNCDSSPVVIQNPVAGTIFTGGSQTITLTATDAKSNFSTCSFTISSVADTQAPTITCPANQKLACGSLVPSYFSLLTVTDNIDTLIDLTQFPGEGSDFYDGMTINFTATDDAGNTTDCSIIVTSSSPDVTPPTFNCPTGLTLNCGDLIPNYAIDPMMNLDDDCSIDLTYIMTPKPGTKFYDGIPIQIEYFDKSGNGSVCNFTVKMANPDVTKPVISCIGNQTLSCGAIIPNYIPLITATDNCDASPIITQSPVAGSPFVAGMAITMTATDASANFETCSFLVNVSADVIKPVISCVGNQSLASGTAIIPNYISLITATDNCDASPIITQNPVAGSSFVDGMTITMTATDASSNFETCSFIVNASVIPDVTKPVITCVGNQNLACGTAVIPDYTRLITATDNVDTNPIITQSPVAGSSFVNGMTITISAKDNSNNTATCSFKIRQLPVSVSAGSDVYIVKEQAVLLNAASTGNGSFSWTPSNGLSNTSIANPVARPLETTTYTVLYTDMGGCSAEDKVTIYVEPEEKDDTKYGFSPNDDGIRDYWKIDTIEEYPNNEVFIYNRWGDLVFQIKNYNNTTNVFSGIANQKRDIGADLLPEGTYFFDIKIKGTHHLKKTKGFLVLKR